MHRLPVHPKRIAILKPSALGDIVHTLPVLGALREYYPDAGITWVVNRAYEPLLAGHPDLTETLTFDRGVYKKSPLTAASYSFQFVNTLRRKRFDLVIDLQGLLRTGLMAWGSAAPARVGFAAAREGSRHAYTHRVDVPDADRIHAVDRYWRVAEFLGIADRPKRFVLPNKPEETAAVDRDFHDLPRPWLVFAVGARWLTKRWRPEHFASLARQAQAEFGGTCFFVGTADDSGLSQQVIQELRGETRNLAGQTSLPRLTALLSRSDVMIANDTGPLHLADALGTPCIAPYTCTKTMLHGPYQSKRGAVETAVPCRGSYLRECPNNMVCMTELTPEKLWGPLSEALLQWSKSSRSA